MKQKRKQRDYSSKTYNMSLQEVGIEIGCSAQRVWEVEQSALKKLKAALLERFGNSVTIADVFPVLKEDRCSEFANYYSL